MGYLKSTIVRKIILYVTGLFVLALGIGFSIQAGLGVSPVSSLPYAFSLISGLSIGVTSVIANLLYIVIQVIFKRSTDFKDFSLQLMVVFLFGFFMDATFFIVQLLPQADSIIIVVLYFVVSLLLVPCGLLGYIFAKLQLMPFDAMNHIISEHYTIPFSKVKVINDVINVCVAGAICLIFIQMLGSIGLGTVISALLIGKILGWMMKCLQRPLEQWMYMQKNET